MHEENLMRLLRTLLAAGMLAFGAGATLAQVAGCPMPAPGAVQLIDTGLPVAEIWTNANAPILNREDYVKGCMRITDGSKQTYRAGLYQGALEIRGRGNSTWYMPKKSYRVKLASPGAQVLDMPADRDWVLLANYADKTLMRGDVGFELSRRLGMAWTPRMHHVELYLNGEYQGNYQLGEQVKVAPERVNIAVMKASDITEPNVSGGYLLEVEYHGRVAPGDVLTSTSSDLLFYIKAPDSSTGLTSQVNYIQGYLQNVENQLLSNNFSVGSGYPKLIDTPSFIDWWIAKELGKDIDGAFGSSVYLNKDRGGKLGMGPLWDYDLAFGNYTNTSDAQFQLPTGWWIRTNSEWYSHLFEDPAFRAQVYDRWKEVKKKQIDTLPHFIDQTAKDLEASQRENFKRWPILDKYVWPNAIVTGSYKGEVRYLKEWLKKRIEWMDKNLKPDKNIELDENIER